MNTVIGVRILFCNLKRKMLFCLYPIFKAILVTIFISFFVSWSIFRKYLRRQADLREQEEKGPATP